ncbi:MAG: DUF6351 family protein [Actinomycetota bacterium]
MAGKLRPRIVTQGALGVVVLASVFATAGSGPSAIGASARGADADVQIKVLSNRADLISGGDAYVRIVVPRVSVFGLEVDLEGRDVSDKFALRDGRILGKIRGLTLGKSVLTARLPDGRGARITITNHPKGGPVFSGKQVRPWICETEASGLRKARDKKCNAPTKYEYFYKSTDPSKPGLQDYDPKNPPSDVATTTTDQGKEVPFIVRRETGTQNRGVYAVAVLFDPAKPWKPWASQRGWNHKLVWPFGVSCGTEYRQAEPTDVLDDEKLGLGFMLANSSLNVLGNNCNTVTSAESVMMLKEHIVESYGNIRYTMGQGCSGGSIGQHVVANAYPGLINGIQPNCSFEDVYSTGNEVVDCHLLLHYFNETAPHLWNNDAQRAAVTGHQTESTCVAWEALFASVPDPTTGCALPEEKEYDPETNPDGTRCTTQDLQVGVWGRRLSREWTAPEKEIKRGFANAPFDNVGVQYGLNALNSGEITAEQFVDLNEKIGGVDIDFTFQPERVRMRREVARILYRTGQINDGAHLDRVPIIDLRGTSNSEIHTDYHSYAMRARLNDANGDHDNQIIWTGPVALVGDTNMMAQSFFVLDEWLTEIERDERNLPLTKKIALNKPAVAVDSCWIGGEQITDMNRCRALFPYFAAPRIAAGGPSSHDVSKCARKPLSRSDYNVMFTDEQWERLHAAFPRGVCDYNMKSIGKKRSITWVTFAGGPGGRPVGPPPKSRPLWGDQSDEIYFLSE